MRRWFSMGLMVVMVGCQPTPDLARDRFFSLAAVHRIEIRVDPGGVNSLLERPREYVPGQVVIDGAHYPEVGVRLKGGAGSFVALDGDYPEISGDGNGRPGKSALIIDFNRSVKGENHLGLKKLTLNNLVQDNSCLHEYLGYLLFREGDVPASRSGYASVFLNGEEKGLYAVIETPDNRVFQDNWFDTNKGNLYEGEYGADLRPESVDHFDQDSGAYTNRIDLGELASALDAITDQQDPLPVLERYIDMDRYLSFAATEIFLGHWDGYAQSANNYQIYHDLDDDRWTFIPWGIDQLFIDQMGPYSGVLMHHGGRVHQLCLASSNCRMRLHQAFGDVFDRVERIDLSNKAKRAWELVGQLALAESSAYGDPDLTNEARDQVDHFIQERREEIERWLPCLAGEAVDQDQDGHDGCAEDCDDHNPGRHPDATEECNFEDDDCNGVVDDPPDCPKCFDEEAPDGHTYALCFEQLTWEQARSACLERGQDLASIHDLHTFEHLTIALAERARVEFAWIGLNDRESEGDFVWTDGTDLDFEHWGPESPKPWGEQEDCVNSAHHGWMDVPCDERAGYICK